MEPISTMAATVAAVIISLGPTFMWTSLVAYVVAKIARSCNDDTEISKLKQTIVKQEKEMECLRDEPSTVDHNHYFRPSLTDIRLH